MHVSLFLMFLARSIRLKKRNEICKRYIGFKKKNPVTIIFPSEICRVSPKTQLQAYPLKHTIS